MSAYSPARASLSMLGGRLIFRQLHRSRAFATASSPAAGLSPRLVAMASEELELVAVGAHMSGLALNHQLLDLGARLVGPAKTAAVYRLYSLVGSAGSGAHVLVRCSCDGRMPVATHHAGHHPPCPTHTMRAPAPDPRRGRARRWCGSPRRTRAAGPSRSRCGRCRWGPSGEWGVEKAGTTWPLGHAPSGGLPRSLICTVSISSSVGSPVSLDTRDQCVC